jgi:hypothetical protein
MGLRRSSEQGGCHYRERRSLANCRHIEHS